MYLLFLFPLASLFFSWGILLPERRKNPVPRAMLAIAIVQTALTVSAVIACFFGLVAPLFTALFFGLPCTFWLITRAREQKYHRCTGYTEGKIVDLVFHGTGGGTSCYPVISFGVDGKYYTAESDVPCSRNEKGKTCWVKYNPADPNEITQEEYGQMTKKVFRILSVICLVIAVISLFITVAELVTL